MATPLPPDEPISIILAPHDDLAQSHVIVGERSRWAMPLEPEALPAAVASVRFVRWQARGFVGWLSEPIRFSCLSSLERPRRMTEWSARRANLRPPGFSFGELPCGVRLVVL